MTVRRLQYGVLLVAALALFAALGTLVTGSAYGSHPPVASPAEYVGRDACARCHVDIAEAHRESGMARALHMPATAALLRENPRLTMKSGPFTYEIVRRGSESIYSVTDGTATLSAPIVYVVGQGKAGQTYLYKIDDAFYESRVSYFLDIKGLDFTIGYSAPEKGTPLVEALGRKTPVDEIRSCLGCHSTAAVVGADLRLDRLVPGVGCESCHGPGSTHVANMLAAKFDDLQIENPGRMSGDELSQDFCGKCHRSAEQVLFMPKLAGINNVRFQPYRIFGSKCYSDDRRISCVGCHDPHAKVEENVAAYDANCLSCHTAKGKTSAAGATEPPCPVGTSKCASCHMPKIDLPGAHMKFTDHRIRIVRPGGEVPL